MCVDVCFFALINMWCVRTNCLCACVMRARKKKGVCVEKLHGEMWTIVLMHKRHERAFHVRARVCLSIHYSSIVCVVCISVFILHVCVPPFEGGGDVVWASAVR